METVWSVKSEWNARRYGRPWIAKVKENSTGPNFDVKVGEFTGQNGEVGDIVVYEPVEGQVYVSGQKDHRKGASNMSYYQYTDGKFVEVRYLGGKWEVV